VSLWVVPRDVSGALGLEFQYSLLNKTAIISKQIIDYGISLLAALLLSPFFLIAAVLIKLDSPGPIIFKQTRMGRNGRPFELYKFRTMFADADQILADLLSTNADMRAEYDQYHKIRSDPRITRMGRLLRRFSFDEFPQIFNVLLGDMSLSGPRPYLPAEKEEMEDYVKLILRVKPGITGWWQVLGRNDVDFTHRLEMDEFYISNWSVWMDIYIFLKTFKVIWVGRAY
jgi:Undecaprenyl-phosphate galactose phosphotransferase WbaP